MEHDNQGLIPRVFNVHLRAFLVRCIFITHSLVAIWRVVTSTESDYYWLLALACGVQILDYFYTSVVRKGNEGYWYISQEKVMVGFTNQQEVVLCLKEPRVTNLTRFCPCFFFYLLSSVPAIWILELDRLARYAEIYENNNGTHMESLSVVQGVSLPITLSPSLWMSVIEQSFLFLIIIGRWILPRGELTRDKLSQLLFVYIGMASDIMDLFVLFEEPDVRQDKTYTYVILVIWSVSLLQFSIVLTATKSPKKPRTALVHPEEGAEVEEEKARCASCCSCLKSEIWSLLLSFMMQDGPFLTCRLYGLIRYHLITYSIIFYTCKNIFVVMLLLYRLFVLCCIEPENETEKVAQRALKKAAVVRTIAKSSHGRISTVEDEFNGGGRRPRRDRRNGVSRKPSTARIVDIE